MNGEHGDQLIRDLFKRLADEAARRAPPFSVLWEAARVRRGLRLRWRLSPAWAAASAVFIVIVGLWRAWLQAPQPARPAAPMTIAEWKSPTDFLLRTPGQLNGRLP